MIASVSNFVNRRRRGLTVFASVAGGAYFLTSYARQRFTDMTERSITDRAAKENLRRRFHQNQEDCAFTLIALLPVLSKQVLEELDVEALTAELQRRAEETKKGKAKAAAALQSSQTDATLAESTTSLPDAVTASGNVLVNGGAGMNGHRTPTEMDQETEAAAAVPLPDEAGQGQEGQIQKESHMNGEALQPAAEITPSDTPVDPRSKAELWHATKILAFQRTVTSLYLLSLLILQTHVQLNLLGRHNYISSVYEQAWASATSSKPSDPFDLIDEPSLEEARLDRPEQGVDATTEQQYLTFTWWFLQRGWKYIDARVKEATEEVLESVSLKTALSAQDLNKLLREIRRKVEYEATGAVRSFSAALFPQTAEQERETIVESGMASRTDGRVSSSLRVLLNETQDFLDSPDCSIVLRSCLDRAFVVLSSSISHLFIDNEQQASAGLRIEELQEKKVRLAAILPALATSTHAILNGVPNEYAEALADNRELLEFSAVVYSNFAVDE